MGVNGFVQVSNARAISDLNKLFFYVDTTVEFGPGIYGAVFFNPFTGIFGGDIGVSLGSPRAGISVGASYSWSLTLFNLGLFAGFVGNFIQSHLPGSASTNSVLRKAGMYYKKYRKRVDVGGGCSGASQRLALIHC